jgi:hypothetical protein
LELLRFDDANESADGAGDSVCMLSGRRGLRCELVQQSLELARDVAI